MKAYGYSDTGKIRKENQDTFVLESFADKGMYLCVVCDGMGGAKGGKIASEIGTEAFVSHVRTRLSGNNFADPGEILLEAAGYANKKILQRALTDANCSGMGTTMVSALICGNKLTALNIGDSRAYILSEDGIRLITRDHSYVEDLVRRGDITAEQARRHPRKNLITRALGIDDSANCDIFYHEAGDGDLLVLCTDGLSNELTDDEILQAALDCKDEEEICLKLVGLTLSRGAPDNVTVVAARISS